MKERPILFNGAMVRAILSGAKTQTRRVVKNIPWREGCNPQFSQAAAFSNHGDFRIAGSEEMTTSFRCPYGQPGDRLWVRETHAIFPTHGQHRADGERWGPWGGLPSTVSDDGKQIAYYCEGFDRCDPGRWRPSIHMPRWACRILLEITAVRLERLQAGDGDTDFESRYLPEGINRIHHGDGDYYYSAFRDEPHPTNWNQPEDAFRELWTSTGGDWHSNPWVWVIEFKRVEA